MVCLSACLYVCLHPCIYMPYACMQDLEPYAATFTEQILVKFNLSSSESHSGFPVFRTSPAPERSPPIFTEEEDDKGVLLVLRQESPDAPWLPLLENETLTIDASGRATLRLRSFGRIATVWFGGGSGCEDEPGVLAAQTVAEALRVAGQKLLVKPSTRLDLAVGTRMRLRDYDEWALGAHASAAMLEEIAQMATEHSSVRPIAAALAGIAATAITTTGLQREGGGGGDLAPSCSSEAEELLEVYTDVLQALLAPSSLAPGSSLSRSSHGSSSSFFVDADDTTVPSSVARLRISPGVAAAGGGGAAAAAAAAAGTASNSTAGGTSSSTPVHIVLGQVRNATFCAIYTLKCIILPRQARNKHR